MSYTVLSSVFSCTLVELDALNCVWSVGVNTGASDIAIVPSDWEVGAKFIWLTRVVARYPGLAVSSLGCADDLKKREIRRCHRYQDLLDVHIFGK